MHACVHANDIAGSTARQWKHPACSPQEQQEEDCSIRCGEEEISSWKKPMEFPIQSHLWLTSAWRGYISMSMAYITVEWRAQQHAREAVESTASGATAAIQ